MPPVEESNVEIGEAICPKKIGHRLTQMTQIEKCMGILTAANVLIRVHPWKSVASFAAFDYNLGPCALIDEISCVLPSVSPVRR